MAIFMATDLGEFGLQLLILLLVLLKACGHGWVSGLFHGYPHLNDNQYIYWSFRVALSRTSSTADRGHHR
jgi:hypothetical protein